MHQNSQIQRLSEDLEMDILIVRSYGSQVIAFSIPGIISAVAAY
jgi:hypothetical protein